MINNGAETFCYGCGVCAISCPKKIIKIEKSNEGFWVPIIDEAKCVNCGVCDKVCSHIDSNVFLSNKCKVPAAYAIINKNREVRRKSTSGGAGMAIAHYYFLKGYKAVGVRYVEGDNIACHYIANTLEEFEETMNSKYLPSYTVDAFSSLFDGHKYVIFGTPCQIDSLRRMVRLRGKEDDFIFIDLFCHGVPSYLHWGAYLDYHQKDVSRLESPIFRDKRNGWHAYTMTLKTSIHEISTTLQDNDLFQNIYLGNYVLNKSCYECKFRGVNSSADLRMGDLWGRKYAKDEEGVTGILVFTPKVDPLLDVLSESCEVIEESLNTILEGQLHCNIAIPPMRDKLLKGFLEKKSLSTLYFKYAYRMWIKNLIPYAVKVYVKNFLYLIRK